MPFVTRKPTLALTVVAIAGLLIVGGFIWFGIYNVGRSMRASPTT